MIGIFDSGVGGLSVLQEVQKVLPNHSIHFFADTAHVPYGERSDDDIRTLVCDAVRRLVTLQPDVVVVACNTATSVAMTELRRQFPHTPFVGVVPVIKPLAETTRTGNVAMLGTHATLRSRTYQDLRTTFASHINVLDIPAPLLVRYVEGGEHTGQRARNELSNITSAIRDFGADVVGLGSTHFPWLRPQLEQLLPGVTVMDSGEAVARQTQRILAEHPHQDERPLVRYYVSGDLQEFSRVASMLLAASVQAERLPDVTSR